VEWKKRCQRRRKSNKESMLYKNHGASTCIWFKFPKGRRINGTKQLWVSEMLDAYPTSSKRNEQVKGKLLFIIGTTRGIMKKGINCVKVKRSKGGRDRYLNISRQRGCQLTTQDKP
jgi:hypothetical protein